MSVPTIKTDDLTPAQINMLVAVAEGWLPPNHPKVVAYRRDFTERTGDVAPRTVWEDLAGFHDIEPLDYCRVNTHAGPIIDRELISTMASGPGAWVGGYEEAHGEFEGPWATGVTRLETAMRAYVRKVYGDSINATDKPWLLEAAAS